MTGVKVLDLDNLPEHGVLLVNREEMSEATVRALLQECPSGIHWAFYVEDIDNALAILSEEDLNKAGWFKRVTEGI